METLEEAARLSRECKELFNEAELHRIKGCLLLARHGARHETAVEAESCFHQALDVSRQQQSRSLELRAAISLARLLHLLDRHTEAYGTLLPVYEWFTEGFDTTDLKDARDLLEGLDRSSSTEVSERVG